MTEPATTIERILRHQSGVGDGFSFHNETPLAAHVDDGGLDLDSLDRVEVAMRIEDALGIEIPDDDVDSAALGTFGGLCAYARGKLDVKCAA